MQKNKRTLAGFTLIELLLVIVILGILIVIALSVINPVRLQRRSREAVVLAQTSKLCTALFACAAASTADTDCNTLALIGVPTSPDGNPAGSTYAVSSSSSVVTVTGTMTGTAGSKNNAACAITCSYDFSTGTATPVTKTLADCY